MLAAALRLSAGQAGSPGASDAGPGPAVYAVKCAPCHGADGKGNGPYATFLSPRPRDFTAGVYAFRTTESGSIPTDEDLLRTIRAGLPGSAMPSWQKFLSGDSLTAVLAYAKSFSPRFQSDRPQPVKIGSPVPSSAASIGAGAKVFEKLQCASCHGTDGAGAGATATDFQDAAGYPIRAANLTEPWTFHGGSAPRDIYLRFRTGIDGTPMPSYVGAATDREMWDLANYVVSIARKPLWKMDAGEVAQFYAAHDTIAGKDPEARGRYLVRTLGCGDCHTPTDGKGGMMEQFIYAGGQRWRVGPYGEYSSYNLTSDSATGLGAWKDEEIKKFITTGIRRDGTRMLPFPMPWPAFASLREDDLNAIVTYLRTLPPVRNEVPKPKPLGFFPYLLAKFKMLVLREPFDLYIYAGNDGSVKHAAEPEHGVVPKEEHP